METFGERDGRNVRSTLRAQWSSLPVQLLVVTAAVVVGTVVSQLNASKRTRESIRLCAAKYQEARNAADTAVVDAYQVVPPEPLRQGAIPAIVCRKYRGGK